MSKYSDASAGNYPLEKALVELSMADSMGMVGNVYYVIPSSKAYYQSFLKDKYQVYSDGSASVIADSGNGAGIQTAITNCKGGRGDYIFVLPGTYTQTTALDFSGRSSVHLIAVNGPMYNVGSTSACYLIQSGAYANVIMSANSELAGFAIKNKAGYSAVTIPTNIFSTNIHNNYFMMVQGNDINIIDASASEANKMGRIHHNRFYSEVTGVLKSVIWCSGGYAKDVDHNEISSSGGTITYGIMNDSTGGFTCYNSVSECGGLNASVISTAIEVRDTAGGVVGNRCAVGTGQGVSGGTVGHTFVDNRDGQAGGETCIET